MQSRYLKSAAFLQFSFVTAERDGYRGRLIYIAEPSDGYNRGKMWMFASITAKFAFAGGAAIVSFFLIRHSRRYFGRGENRLSCSPVHTKNVLGTPSSWDERLHPTPNANALPDNVGGILPVHDTVRDLMGELDTKMAAFQALLRLGNEMATRLEVAIERAEQVTKSATNSPADVSQRTGD